MTATCGAPPNADCHLPPCDKPAGHDGPHGAVGYEWGEHPTLGMLNPVPVGWGTEWPNRHAAPSFGAALLAEVETLARNWSQNEGPSAYRVRKCAQGLRRAIARAQRAALRDEESETPGSEKP